MYSMPPWQCVPIQQYMGDAQNKDHMSEKDIANELVIEPAMRSVGIQMA